jgi:hypothetical protein
VNRADLESRLLKLSEMLSTYPLNPSTIAAEVRDLAVEVATEWTTVQPRAVLAIDDDGAGFVVDLVRSWRVEPKYGAKGGEAGCHTLVYFRGIEHAQSFNGDLHDALSSALRGGRT